ncbi:hypothetical protein PC116_g6793 [Phytophthora cactorum]|nr:hypothetical protein PC114_g17386 [Phytophthora cactorum]KAG3010982.1 hypothetical protein PC120_g14720 [Phytophthora cactorum]KAG4245412.1 hypothetical protein PC116_g6793 [Phytophthora cactorum]
MIWIKWAEMKQNIVMNIEFQDSDKRLDDESGDYPRQAWKKHEFKCLGWVETDDDGDELGTRRECWQRIQAGDAGYCQMTLGSRANWQKLSPRFDSMPRDIVTIHQ